MSTRHTIYYHDSIHIYRDMEELLINKDLDLKDCPLHVDSDKNLAFLIRGNEKEKHLFIYEMLRDKKFSFARVVKYENEISFTVPSANKEPYLLQVANHLFNNLVNDKWLYSNE